MHDCYRSKNTEYIQYNILAYDLARHIMLITVETVESQSMKGPIFMLKNKNIFLYSAENLMKITVYKQRVIRYA